MNRAWIPAGALASVSVAGLIALGPLTDSLGTQVSFQSSVAVTTQTPPRGSVPVSYAANVVGSVSHASLVRGGQAGITASPNSDAGLAGFKRTTGSSHSNSTAAVTTTPKVTKKPPAQRPTSISGSSGPNGDAGFAGSGPKSSNVAGEQSSTLGSDPAP